jgi:hypothetical protein
LKGLRENGLGNNIHSPNANALVENSYFPLITKITTNRFGLKGFRENGLGNSIHSLNANADPLGEAEFKSPG